MRARGLRSFLHGFNHCWLLPAQFPAFHPWLERDSSSTKNAKCSFCHKTIELSNMGKKAISDHAKGKIHKENARVRLGQSRGQSTIGSYFGKGKVSGFQVR